MVPLVVIGELATEKPVGMVSATEVTVPTLAGSMVDMETLPELSVRSRRVPLPPN
jgi:hypothetical protein